MKGKLKPLYIVCGVVSIVILAFVYSPDPSRQGQKQEPEQKIAEGEITKISEPVIVPERDVIPITDPNPYTQKVLAQYEAFIERAIRAGTSPGAAVAIVKDSSIIYLKGFGLKQTGKPDSINTNTVFRLGSVSKCFASVLAGTLVSDHVFDWDDPVIKYLPDFALKSKESTEKLTLRHVLSHTIGLPYHAFTNMIEERAPLDTLLKELRYLDLIGEPGKVYSYQNVGYSLIGEVIKATTHKSFEESLTEKLFLPLQMKNSSASYEAMVNNPNIAKPHLFSRKRWVSIPVSDTYYDVTPAGGVNASIADMALWLKALLGNEQDVLTNATLDQIFEPQVKAKSKNRNFYKWQRPKASYYAMGWRVLTFKNDTIEYHGGYVNGYRSEVALDRKNRIAICVLTNSAGNLADQSIPEFFTRFSQQADSIAQWENRNKYFLVANRPKELQSPILN
jgi:beta-lactamase class C